jgi:hypothetical protein
VLRERAGLQPNDTAFTFTDYEQDWAGVAESLTWSQMYRRTCNVACEVGLRGSVGDRAVILAPQGLDYIAAFLGAIQAGFIAIPLSVPQVGSHDERVSAVLADTSPSVILTTSAVAPNVTEYVAESNADARPTVIEVDAVDLDARNGLGHRLARSSRDAPTTMYLQYTSGSTRVPAGVMISDGNLAANFRQLMSEYFPNLGGMAPPDTTIVTWLPFYHDMGLMLGVFAPILGGYHAKIVTPVAFLGRNVGCAPARPIAVLEVNGTGDPLVPFDGGTLNGAGGPGTVLSAPAMAARWREIDGCQGDPSQDVLSGNGDGTEVHRFTATACADGTAVVFMQVDNGGHTWPGGTHYLPKAIIGPTSHAFDASETSWRFFASHAR